MPSTKDTPSATELRLASARRRLRAFIAQIRELEAADFPQKDSQDALQRIRSTLSGDLAQLSDPDPTKADELVDRTCAQVTLKTKVYTQVLGFILRSTNVRNAFEVHFPLRRLVQQVIAPDARLIMSSEWDFTPFAYPINLDYLPGFVLVGSPAPESGNVLLLPLAGHEIGHCAWRHHEIIEQLKTKVSVAVSKVTAADQKALDRILGVLRDGDGLEQLQNTILYMSLKQIEEIFCDLFGLYVFGRSYLYAYEYLMAPGGGSRGPTYPDSVNRVDYLLKGADALGLQVDVDLFDRWLPSGPRPGGPNPDTLIFADAATAAVFEELMNITFKFLEDKEVPPPRREDRVAMVKRAFEGHAPHDDDATFTEIITAGWDYLRERGGLSGENEQGEYAMLGELMLKSIEVAEYRFRVTGNA